MEDARRNSAVRQARVMIRDDGVGDTRELLPNRWKR